MKVLSPEFDKNKFELKQLLKEAVVEALEERGDLISNAVEDALEDRYLAEAMEVARKDGLADKKKVARLLNLSL